MEIPLSADISRESEYEALHTRALGDLACLIEEDSQEDALVFLAWGRTSVRLVREIASVRPDVVDTIGNRGKIIIPNLADHQIYTNGSRYFIPFIRSLCPALTQAATVVLVDDIVGHGLKLQTMKENFHSLDINFHSLSMIACNDCRARDTHRAPLWVDDWNDPLREWYKNRYYHSAVHDLRRKENWVGTWQDVTRGNL